VSRVGGRIEIEVGMDGAPARYGGVIRTLDAGRELAFENDWIPNQGWKTPTFITLRLTPVLGGTFPVDLPITCRLYVYP